MRTRLAIAALAVAVFAACGGSGSNTEPEAQPENPEPTALPATIRSDDPLTATLDELLPGTDRVVVWGRSGGDCPNGCLYAQALDLDGTLRTIQGDDRSLSEGEVGVDAVAEIAGLLAAGGFTDPDREPECVAAVDGSDPFIVYVNDGAVEYLTGCSIWIDEGSELWGALDELAAVSRVSTPE